MKIYQVYSSPQVWQKRTSEPANQRTSEPANQRTSEPVKADDNVRDLSEKEQPETIPYLKMIEDIFLSQVLNRRDLNDLSNLINRLEAGGNIITGDEIHEIREIVYKRIFYNIETFWQFAKTDEFSDYMWSPDSNGKSKYPELIEGEQDYIEARYQLSEEIESLIGGYNEALFTLPTLENIKQVYEILQSTFDRVEASIRLPVKIGWIKKKIERLRKFIESDDGKKMAIEHPERIPDDIARITELAQKYQEIWDSIFNA